MKNKELMQKRGRFAQYWAWHKLWGGGTEGGVFFTDPWARGRALAQRKYENHSEVQSATKEAQWHLNLTVLEGA